MIEFEPRRCFKSFVETVTADRRAGDIDSSNSAIANTSKLIGNSVYGVTIMNKWKHLDVKFTDMQTAAVLVNNPRFQTLQEFENGCFEVTSRKKSIKFDKPVQIGFFVYQYAKLRMLDFFYNVIQRFIPESNFHLLEMDTDSLYLALSETSLDNAVAPELMEEWKTVKIDWFPRTDTEQNISWDRREPGLFKEEYRGFGFVGLNPKTYFCKGGDTDKLSTKGVQKQCTITYEEFKRVLATGECVEKVNRGFVIKNGSMMTYEMRRKALSYFYAKRKVLADGVTTTYLDV